MKKRILFILQKKHLKSKTNRQHVNWINDCKDNYDFDFWGKDITNTSLKSLQNKIDFFKPDFIYLTTRSRYEGWLPDLTSIKIPKIFVEVDTYKYNANDLWYKQFDKLYCRCQNWKNSKSKIYYSNSKTWNNVPLFRWSVPEKAFMFSEKHKKGVYFVGQCKGPYDFRKQMRIIFREKRSIIFIKAKMDNYWKLLGSASALLCPTESNYGDFIPAKIFEYAASGAVVLTNCDLVSYNMEDLDKVVIHYTDLKDLEEKLKIDFTSHYKKAREIVKNHTHKIRYKELFGE